MSITKRTYDRLYAFVESADKDLGLSGSKVVETAVKAFLDQNGVPEDAVGRARFRPGPKPGPKVRVNNGKRAVDATSVFTF